MIVAEFPYPHIEIECRKCGRRGVYRKERFDQAMRLPDLLGELTKACPKAGPLQMLDRCAAMYPQLIALGR